MIRMFNIQTISPFAQNLNDVSPVPIYYRHTLSLLFCWTLRHARTMDTIPSPNGNNNGNLNHYYHS